MSGIRKGAPRKPAAAAAAAAAPGGKKAPQKAAGAKTSGGGGGSGKAKGATASACFAGCGLRAEPEGLIQHYEKVLGNNEPVHIQALSDKLDPHFGDATHCQICGAEFGHAGLLLQHVFAVATGKKGAGGGAGSGGAAARAHAAEMHATLFSSFVQELVTMPLVGAEEAVEYMLSLTTPDHDADGDDDDEDDDDEDDDDEEKDLYEDDEDADGPVDMEELADFEDFLAAHGLDMEEAMAGMGMGMGPQSRGAKGKGKAGPGGSDAEKMRFMKAFLKMQMGGMDDEDDEGEESEEERVPRGKKGAAAAVAAKGKAKGKPAASAASPVTPSFPPGTDRPGDMKCAGCGQMRNKEMYSAAQKKKQGKRRCKYCVDAAAGASAGAGADADAMDADDAQEAKPAGAKAAAAAAGGKSAPGAAASAAAASSSSAAAAAAKPSASSAAKPAKPHTLHRHHASKHTLANGEEIQSEPEEFEGDGEEQDPAQAEETSDDEEEEEDSDEEEDDSDDDQDPFSALFGGGGRRRGGAGRRGPKHPKSSRHSMDMRLVVERPGQLLRRDRRLRLKPSAATPVRCWAPRSSDQLTCFECDWRTPSRLVDGWQLACLNCALQNDWMEDEEAPASDEDENDENEHEDPEEVAARKLSLAPRVALHASAFPYYRAGLERCARPQCASEKMLLVYDEKGDEYVVCAECRGSKQKLRYFDSLAHRLVDSLQDPITHD